MKPNLVHSQCTSQVDMRVYKNGGYTNYVDIPILNLFLIQTYVEPSYMANILSLSEVTSAKVDPAMYVHAHGFKKSFW